MPRSFAPAFALPLPLRQMVSTSHHTRHFCVRAGLSTPDGLPNLRDLASAAPHRLRPNKLYRGATPAYLPSVPSPEALAFLRSTPVLLDLRSGGERATDHRQTLLTACGPDFPQREVHIGLLSKLQVVSGLARSMPLDSALGLAWHMISRPHRAREAIVGHIDEGGLLLVNRILIELGSAAIGRALHVIADAVSGCGDDDESKSENAAQCYFYCSAGKDRTGMLAALILEVLGVDRADILRDYARSSETWENGPPELLARQDYCARLVREGLTVRKWIAASPEVMDETLSFIDRRFGSVEDYLVHCGFDEKGMARLRSAMAVP